MDLSRETVEALVDLADRWIDDEPCSSCEWATLSDRLRADLARAEQPLREKVAANRRAEEPEASAPEAPAPEECPPVPMPTDVPPSSVDDVLRACEERWATQGEWAADTEGNWAAHAAAVRTLAAAWDALRSELANRIATNREQVQALTASHEECVRSLSEKLAAADERFEEVRKERDEFWQRRDALREELAADKARLAEARAKLAGCFRLPEFTPEVTRITWDSLSYVLAIRWAADKCEKLRENRWHQGLRHLADAIERGPEGGEGVWVTREQVATARRLRVMDDTGRCYMAFRDGELPFPAAWLEPENGEGDAP